MVVAYCAIMNSWTVIIGYCNGFFIAAFTLISIGLLAVLNLFGAFDIFSFYPGRKKKEDGTKESLYDYSTRKKEERGKFKLVFVPYISLGSVYLLVSLVLYFLI